MLLSSTWGKRRVAWGSWLAGASLIVAGANACGSGDGAESVKDASGGSESGGARIAGGRANGGVTANSGGTGGLDAGGATSAGGLGTLPGSGGQGAGAAASWSDRVAVEEDERVASSPQVGVDQEGNALVVWIGGGTQRNVLFAARYDAATSRWSSPEAIDGGEGSVTFGSARLYVDASGAAVAAWIDAGTSKPASAGTPKVTRFEPGSGWSEPEALATALASEVRVAINGEGRAVAAFTTGSTEASVVRSETHVRTFSGSWGEDVILASGEHETTASSERRRFTRAADVAFVDGERAAVLFTTAEGAFAASGWGANFEEPARLDDAAGADGPSGNHRLVSAGEGALLSAWVQNDGVSASLYARRFADGAWQDAEKVENLPGMVTHFGVAASGEQAVVVFRVAGNIAKAWASDVGPGGSWSKPVELANYPGPISVGMSRDGTATALWDSGVSLGAEAARRTGGKWSLPPSRLDNDAKWAQLSVGANGHTVAVWLDEQADTGPTPASELYAQTLAP